MKKKLLWCAGIIVLIALVVLGICRYIEVRNGRTVLTYVFRLWGSICSARPTSNGTPAARLHISASAVQRLYLPVQ